MRILLFLLTLSFSAKSFACGGGYEHPFYYKFFQDYSDTNEIHPYVFQPHYKYHGYESEKDFEPNLNAWKEYFKGKYESADIKKVLYGYGLESCIQLNQQINNKVDTKDVANKFEKALLKGKENDFVNYLIYAKKCEVLALEKGKRYYSWHDDNKSSRDSSKTSSLINEGIALYGSIKNEELKTRYGFQLVRLAHYEKQYNKGVNLFCKYVQPLQSEKYIFYRAWEQYAGLLHSLNKIDSAGYIFSRVFDNCPDRRECCVASFNFGRSNFRNVYDLCKNKKEQGVLYAMRALTHSGSPLGELINLLDTDPCSQYVEWFFTQQVYDLEKELFKKKDYWSDRGKESPFRKGYGASTLNELNEIAINMQTKCLPNRKEFWMFNEAYVYFMQQEHVSAKNTLSKLSSPEFEASKKELEIACDLLLIDKLTPELEQKWALKSVKFNNRTKDLYYNVMRVKFFENGEFAKALLVNNYKTMPENLDTVMLNLLIEFKQRKPVSSIEKLLQKKVDFDLLYASKGSYYFQRDELEKALLNFNKVKDLSKASISSEFSSWDLFQAAKKHVFNYSFDAQSSPVLKSKADLEYLFEEDKKSLVELLMMLKATAKKFEKSSPQDAAKIYYNMGVAWNNMSPYGWHRPIQYSGDYDGSNCCNDYTYYVKTPSQEVEHEDWDFRAYMRTSKSFYNPDIARGYLEKALKFNLDDEVEARIVFKLSEVALYSSYAGPKSYYYGVRRDTVVEPNRRKWYTQLHKLEDTQYYKEVIQECGYFRSYINNH